MFHYFIGDQLSVDPYKGIVFFTTKGWTCLECSMWLLLTTIILVTHQLPVWDFCHLPFTILSSSSAIARSSINASGGMGWIIILPRTSSHLHLCTSYPSLSHCLSLVDNINSIHIHLSSQMPSFINLLPLFLIVAAPAMATPIIMRDAMVCLLTTSRVVRLTYRSFLRLPTCEAALSTVSAA